MHIGAGAKLPDWKYVSEANPLGPQVQETSTDTG